MAPTNTCSHCVTRGHLVLLHQVLVSFVLCPENLRLYKTGFCFSLLGSLFGFVTFPSVLQKVPFLPALLSQHHPQHLEQWLGHQRQQCTG